ncbi:MAG TPA: DNA-directed DNA polymerase [Candidatus Nanoarchaeia archaeon]|nr:DNA-directed DNA polymerase [Candidatus Nanoarchaeia archaeon]
MAKITFFPIDITYKIESGKAVIYMFGRTADGKQVCVADRNFEPYFYVIPKKGENVEEKLLKLKVESDGQTAEVVRTERIKKKFLGSEVNAVKVFTKLPSNVPIIRQTIKDWEMLERVTEYDIKFTKRYLIDKNITPFVAVLCHGDFVSAKAKVPVFEISKLEMKEESYEKPRLLALDIETYNPEGKNIDFDAFPIIMLSFYGNDYKKLITWKRFNTKLDYVEFVKSEAELIERFREIVNEYKPDILTGYFSDEFDLPYIRTRADKYKLKLDIGLDYSELQVKKTRVTTSNIVGINHLDTFKFFKKIMGSSMDTYSLSLNSVASALLNEKKAVVELDKLAYTWDNNPEDLSGYCEYCLQDSCLAFKIAEKLMPNIIEMVKIVGLTVPDISRMGFSQLVESFIMKQASSFNELAPELPHHGQLGERQMHTYKGGFVYEPKPGLYHNIIVFDFRSLYPTIISSHNIDPGTLDCECCEGKKVAPMEGRKKHWFCTKKKGFLPTLIEDLITRRMRLKEIMKKKSTPLLEARSQSLKLLANAFYGYLGFPMARWYSIDSARATAAYGRFYIKKVIDGAEGEGFKVVYSDTDSVFLTFDNKKKEDAFKFQEKINMDLPGIMELDYEGFYPSGIFVSAKVGKFGAKKKYALVSEQGNLKIRGFETVRRNWSPIAKNVQEKVLIMILKEDKPAEAFDYVKSVIKDLRDNKIPLKDVIIHTQLSKEIESYDNVGPHVAIATQMKNKGINVSAGSQINFVITKHGERIRDKAKLPDEVTQDDYDPDYYINNQVVPAVEKIFEVLGYDKKELVESHEQNKLSRFF